MAGKIWSSTSTAQLPAFSERSAPGLSSFAPATATEIIRLLNSSASKSCDFHLIPTSLLKHFSMLVAFVICCLCNLTLHIGIFPSPLDQARVLPLLGKPSLNPDLANPYRPISNLPFIVAPESRCPADSKA
jgi:hypothetical protein